MCSIQTIVSPAFLQKLDSVHQLRGFHIGQAAGDLVEQQRGGAHAQRPRHLQPFAIEEAKAGGATVRETHHAGRLKRFQCEIVGFLGLVSAAVGSRHKTFSKTVMPRKGCGI